MLLLGYSLHSSVLDFDRKGNRISACLLVSVRTDTFRICCFRSHFNLTGSHLHFRSMFTSANEWTAAQIVLYSNIPFLADRFIDFECEENVVHAESERRGKHYQKEENWNEFWPASATLMISDCSVVKVWESLNEKEEGCFNIKLTLLFLCG